MPRYDWVKKIDLARFSLRERVMVLMTAVAVAGFLLFYIYFPAHRQVLTLEQEREQLDQEIMGLEQQLDAARKSSEQMKVPGHTESGKTTDLSASNREGLSLILEELNRMAAATGVDFLSVKPDIIQEKEGLQEQPVLIDLRSTFSGMGKYLQKLENWPRLVKVQNLKIETDPGNAATILVHLYLTVYQMKDEGTGK